MDPEKIKLQTDNSEIPWVSFCMSTYKRPDILSKQIEGLLKQSFKNFNIIISDNDPEESGRSVVNSFNDDRLIYYANSENLGMVKSFNQSILKAVSEFIVMVTDDDPVSPEMLEELFNLHKKYPGFHFYGGIQRPFNKPGTIEILPKEDFVFEILHPKKSKNILWSGCIIHRKSIIEKGGFPDYGSPHLADHLMIINSASETGGVIVNKQFSSLSHHDGNFSKKNFEMYYIGCKEFYSWIFSKYPSEYYIKYGCNSLKLHLYHWFIGVIFNLKNYYTFSYKSNTTLAQIEQLSKEIMKLHFMKGVRLRFLIKNFIYKVKAFAFNTFKLKF